MSVASMSEPESSLREDASESDDAARRRLDLSGELSESESLRDLRFGEELESESEDFERRRDLRFGEGDGEPCLPVSTSRAAVSLTALATWPVNASSKASPAVAGNVLFKGAFAFA